MSEPSLHSSPERPELLGCPQSSRCVSCEEIELANVRDARPSQLLPIPHMAMAGFPEGRSGSGPTPW